VFEISDEISDAILGELRIRLLGEEKPKAPTENMEAYDAYLLGRYHWNIREISAAEGHFCNAVELDQTYAAAYGMLAYLYATRLLYGTEPPQDLIAETSRYIDRALHLDDSQPEALLANAMLWSYPSFDYQATVNEFSELVSMYPNHPGILNAYGFVMDSLGCFDIAYRLNDRVVELDPLSPDAYLDQGLALFFSGRLKEARRSFERAESLGWNQPFMLAALFFREGRPMELKEQLSRQLSEWDLFTRYCPLFEAAYIYLSGNRETVRSDAFAEIGGDGYTSYLMRSYIEILKGNLDASLTYFSRALSDREPFAAFQIQAPLFMVRIFPDYRSHPKYQKMLRDFGLDEESIAKLKIPPLPF